MSNAREDDQDEEVTLGEDDPDLYRYIRGQMIDGGRIVFERRLLRGSSNNGIWAGRQLSPRERAVLITFTHPQYSSPGEELRELHESVIRYDVPGIAPLLFHGRPDGFVAPTPADFTRAVKRLESLHDKCVIVEARPAGDHLLDVERLSLTEVIRLGLGLCDMNLAYKDQGRIIGLRPETVYVAGEHGNRYYAGAAPRAFVMLGNSEMSAPFSYEIYDPPTESVYDRDPDQLVYTVALLIWFALLGTHAFRADGYMQHSMDNDLRAPFTGPPELGRLLEAVLVADVAKRMKAPELREGLAKLAARWNVEPPPFPPPGLA